ncbi:MAG: cytochrome c3 family protein [Nitrospirae bacterium]|nr:cytochrome c3 family protein [Nitrospirota bacterium]
MTNGSTLTINRLVLASVFLLLCAGRPEAQVPKEHTACSSCHIEEGRSALKEGIHETCIRCHPPHPGKDHPVKVVQKVVPDGLPLDKENRITCVTCHEPHGKGTVGRLMRMDLKKLCIACHEP